MVELNSQVSHSWKKKKNYEQKHGAEEIFSISAQKNEKMKT